MSGKGSNRRPNFVPLDQLAARWDATFGGREATNPEWNRTTERPPFSRAEVQRMHDAISNASVHPLNTRPLDPPLTFVSVDGGLAYPSPSAPDERPTE